MEADTSYVVVDGPSFEHGENTPSTQGRPKVNASKPTLSSRHPGGNRDRPDPESEWIVLDLGDDFGSCNSYMLRLSNSDAIISL